MTCRKFIEILCKNIHYPWLRTDWILDLILGVVGLLCVVKFPVFSVHLTVICYLYEYVKVRFYFEHTNIMYASLNKYPPMTIKTIRLRKSLIVYPLSTLSSFYF